MSSMELKQSYRDKKNKNKSPQIIKTEAPTSSSTIKLPENFFQLILQMLDRLGRFRQVLITLLLICGAFTFIWSQIPEQGKLTMINYIFNRPSKISAYYPSVEIDESKFIFDLTEWTPVPQRGDASQACKVTTDENLSYRRIHSDATYLARRAGTTGVRPEFRSNTHDVSYKLLSNERLGGPKMAIYDVLLDISKEPLNTLGKAHLRSIRYGGFSDPKSEWAAHTVMQATRSITIEIRFPLNKPGTNFRFSIAGEFDRSNYVQFQPPTDQYEIKGNTIKWTVLYPKLAYSYRIDWDW